jgi:hypothetical protein
MFSFDTITNKRREIAAFIGKVPNRSKSVMLQPGRPENMFALPNYHYHEVDYYELKWAKVYKLPFWPCLVLNPLHLKPYWRNLSHGGASAVVAWYSKNLTFSRIPWDTLETWGETNKNHEKYLLGDKSIHDKQLASSFRFGVKNAREVYSCSEVSEFQVLFLTVF